jgi:hypothetical protein
MARRREVNSSVSRWRPVADRFKHDVTKSSEFIVQKMRQSQKPMNILLASQKLLRSSIQLDN